MSLSTMVNNSGGHVVQRLMNSLVVVGVDERVDLTLQLVQLAVRAADSVFELDVPQR